MIAANEYEAFRYASARRYLLILRALYDWSSELGRVAMIATRNYSPFQCASANGHLEIARALYNWSSETERVVIPFFENGKTEETLREIHVLKNTFLLFLWYGVRVGKLVALFFRFLVPLLGKLQFVIPFFVLPKCMNNAKCLMRNTS